MFQSLSELRECTATILANDQITDREKLRDTVIDRLIYTVVFTPDPALKDAASEVIQKIAEITGARPSSLHTLYRAVGKGEVSGFTVPAINIRTLTYDTARCLFRVAQKANAGAFIFEIARSEMGYTRQNPQEYAACILAAAIKENYQGPVFLQGDHFQVNKTVFAADPEKELQALQTLIAHSLAARFYNIDIDASTVVDLTQTELSEQQRANYETTAKLTEFIRKNQPDGITVSIGGEIGHIGGENSTVSDFEAFMEGYLPRIGTTDGISKVSVQTGTSHGGIPLTDGKIAEVNLDFSVLSSIGEIAREKYSMGGAVQHGASTLPNSLFSEFVKANTLEIHLATGFQNIVFATMPVQVRKEMESWTLTNMSDEKSNDMTEEQFLYKLRKKSLGPFKEKLWKLTPDEKQPIMQKLEEQFSFLLHTLNGTNTKEVVKKYVS